MRSVRSISLASTTAAVAALSMSAPATAGLEAIVTPGYGSAGDKSPVTAESSSIGEEIWAGAAKPYGAGPIVDGAIGYRPLPFLSFGMTGGLRRSGASSVSGRSTYPNPRRQGLQIGIYVRGYLPLVGVLTRLDPWFSVGTNYVYDKQDYDYGTPRGSQTPVRISLTHHGFGIPLSLGVDYRVLPFLAVGPSFRYEPVAGVSACGKSSDVETTYCSSDSPPALVHAADYAIWSFQVELRLAL